MDFIKKIIGLQGNQKKFTDAFVNENFAFILGSIKFGDGFMRVFGFKDNQINELNFTPLKNFRKVRYYAMDKSVFRFSTETDEYYFKLRADFEKLEIHFDLFMSNSPPSGRAEVILGDGYLHHDSKKGNGWYSFYDELNNLNFEKQICNAGEPKTYEKWKLGENPVFVHSHFWTGTSIQVFNQDSFLTM